MRKIFSFLILSGFVISIITSCGSGANENHGAATTDSSAVSQDSTSAAQTNDTSKIDELTQFKYDKLISNIPIPFDILRQHADVPLKYNQSAVNPTSNLSYYSSSTAKALNLGIYGGDMAYCITYEKFDDMGSYLKCVKKLADDLGIPLAFDQSALTGYKKFGTNKDSLEKIVFNSYAEVDKTLRSNERIGLASLVVTGGWLEGLYATLTTMGNTPKNESSQGLYKKIWEQKNHLDMVIGLLEQFKEDKAFAPIIQDFKSIKSVFDSFSDKTLLNEKEITALAQKVGEVRGKFISH